MATNSNSQRPNNKADNSTINRTGKDANLVKENKEQYPLARVNFYIMAASAALIIIGFLLMLGSGSTTEHFNPDIFSTRRIIVGPTIAFIGFITMAVGIIWRPNKKQHNK